MGLLAGIFIGAFAMLLMNKENNSDNQRKPEETILPKKIQGEKSGDEPAELISDNTNIAEVQKTSQYETFTASDTLFATDTLSAVNADSAMLVTIADTLLDTLASMANLDTAQMSETIIVQKDKLVRTLKIDLKIIAKRVEAAGDSLISEISGIVEPPQNLEYVIEFWRSPIHYKGYKMANNKVLLFGLELFNEVSLYELNEQIYMKHLGGYYILDNTFAFRQFKKLTDEAILADLN